VRVQLVRGLDGGDESGVIKVRRTAAGPPRTQAHADATAL
jgi:hypothetical protein